MFLKRSSMERLLSRISRGFKSDFRWQEDGIAALMEGAQDFIIAKFQKLNRLAIYRERVTITREDVQMDKDIQDIGSQVLFPKVPPAYDSLGKEIREE